MQATVTTSEQKVLTASEWLDVVQSELLGGLIKDGGSAVRFVAAEDHLLDSIAAEIFERSAGLGYHPVLADSGCPRGEGKKPDFHQLHRLFFHIAESIDWIAEARIQLMRELTAKGIRMPGDELTDDYESVARLNGIEPEDLLNDYKKLVTSVILRDYGMARELRIALAALGRSQLIPEELAPSTAEILLGWFTGRAETGSSAVLKRIRIFERINRSNARFMLRSLTHWLPTTGKVGLVLVLDFRAYERIKQTSAQAAAHIETRVGEWVSERIEVAVERYVEEPAVYYGPSAYIQGLDMLRHMIDSIEQQEKFLLVVLGSPEFFDDRPKSGKSRRFTDYNALQTRIGLEVRDEYRQNPSASLVRIGEAR